MIRFFGEMRVDYPQNVRCIFVVRTKIFEIDYCQKFDNLRYKNNAIRHSRYVSPFCLYTVIADIKGSAGVGAKKAGVQPPAVKAVGWMPAHSEKSKKGMAFCGGK